MLKRIKAKPRSHVRFTRPFLDGLLKKKPDEQRTVWDEKQSGLCILHSPGPAHRKESTITFRAVYYTKDKPGIPRYVKIGRYGEVINYRDPDGALKSLDCTDIEAVRRRCSEIRNASKAGVDPKHVRTSGNVGEVVALYLKERASKNKTSYETERIFNRYVLPEWQDRNLEEIERSDITALLSKIADGKIKHQSTTTAGRMKKQMIGTPNVATATLAQISAMFSWYAAKYASDRFRSPIVKGMAETSWGSKPRTRVLSDDEIWALWEATADQGVYSACVRSALLTAQRFLKVAHMRRVQIKDGVWDAREENDPDNKQVSEVPLSSLALDVINSVPIIDAGRRSQDYVFTLNGTKPFNGFGNAKEVLDKRMADILGTELQPWQHRDLRRTAKTLMARAKVNREISERCLAHVMSGVEGVYDRYDYLPEKLDAFQKLSNLVEEIVYARASEAVTYPR